MNLLRTKWNLTVLALKLLGIKGKQTKVRLSSIVTLMSLVLVATSLLVALAMYQGFYQFIKEKILEKSPHLYMFPLTNTAETPEQVAQKISGIDEIKWASAYYYKEVLLQEKQETTPMQMMAYSNLNIITGTYKQPRNSLEKHGVWISYKLQKSDQVSNKVTVISAGLNKLSRQELSIIGRLDMPETDMIMQVKDPEKEFGAARSILVWLHNISDVTTINNVLKTTYKNTYRVVNWQDMHQTLFTSLKLQKIVAIVVSSIIILLCFSLLVTALSELSLSRRKDIGLLKALGFSQKDIQQIFVLMGASISIAGLSIAAILTYILLGLFNPLLYVLEACLDIEIIPQHWGLQGIPLQLNVGESLAILTSLFLLNLIAVQWPAKKAAKIEALKVLKEHDTC
ncbi:MAG: FtsX-like permease family protein [bacterium]